MSTENTFSAAFWRSRRLVNEREIWCQLSTRREDDDKSARSSIENKPADPGQGSRGSITTMRRTRVRNTAYRTVCARRRARPNVLVILIDDVGYGASSAFGGPCQTPN